MGNDHMMDEKISIVLPIYNEERCIKELLTEIERVVDYPLEFILVDDGSTDNTLSTIRSYQMQGTPRTKKIVVLSRNFGHQQALMAGLCNVSDDAAWILVMDADYQDFPEDIPCLLEKIKEGYDCVYAIRKSRNEGFLIRILIKAFYKIQTRIVSFSIPPNSGTFSIFNKRILEKVLMFKESDIYFPALRAYVGYRQTGIPLKRGKRADGKSRVGLLGLLDLSSIALFNFSGMPMRFIFISGVFTVVLCVICSLIVFGLKIYGITTIPGITTILIFMVTFFGIQIMFIGIVGEYVGRLLKESKKRPRWIVKDVIDE